MGIILTGNYSIIWSSCSHKERIPGKPFALIVGNNRSISIVARFRYVLDMAG